MSHAQFLKGHKQWLVFRFLVRFTLTQPPVGMLNLQIALHMAEGQTAFALVLVTVLMSQMPQGDDATGNAAWSLEHDDGVRHEDVQAEGWPQPHAYACDAGDASQGEKARKVQS